MSAPTATQQLIDHFAVKLNGSDLPAQLMDRMLECRVEQSVHLPDVCTVRFQDSSLGIGFTDQPLEMIDTDKFPVGAALHVEASHEQGGFTPLFKGEIVGLEMDFAGNGNPTIVVRALSKLHRMHRTRKRKAFVQSTFSDIVNQVAGENGLTASSDSTGDNFEWIFQNNETDWEFLSRLASRCGYLLYASDESELAFKKLNDPTSPVKALKWGEELRSFRLRLSASPQVNKVTVKGWDPKAKQAIVGVATSENGEPQVGHGKKGGQFAQSAFGNAEMVLVDQPITTQSDAEKLAQSVIDGIGSGFMEAQALCFGSPEIKAGTSIDLSGIGNRYSGQYHVSSATHSYTPAEGYATQFNVSGKKSEAITDLLQEGRDKYRHENAGNIVIGIVTNNEDPDDLGRVKVKYPWLQDDQESFWARIAAPMAGPDRGFQFLPEINDEVLIAFEHGDIHRPYIIGALWNGVDKPNDTTAKNVSGGKVVQRTIRTRKGHYVLFDDNDGAEKIFIKTSKDHKFTMDDKQGDEKIEVETKAGHKFTMDDAGAKIVMVDKTGSNKMTIDSNANSIKLECMGNFDIKAMGQITIDGTAGITVKTPAMMSLEAQGMATFKSTGPMTIQSTAILTIQGSLVKIN